MKFYTVGDVEKLYGLPGTTLRDVVDKSCPDVHRVGSGYRLVEEQWLHLIDKELERRGYTIEVKEDAATAPATN